jgi:methylated-DNA-[protein]-cysteine S-methyltransferase
MILETEICCISIGYIDETLFCEFGKRKFDKDPTKNVIKQIECYFKGTFTSTFDVALPEGPPFTRKCWEECRKIPFGETISYAELAKYAGSPKTMRAAGQAMRNNPLAIITPCHRVISSTGSLHGYAGVTNAQSIEVTRKKCLIEHELRTMRV